MSSIEKIQSFKSLTYHFGLIYNFVCKRLYEWDKKFVTIANLVGHSEERNLKVLDLACGTGYLANYLHPSIDYEGWDLNAPFLKRLKRLWEKGRIKVKRMALKLRNIFDFDKYPTEQKDVIVLSGILHHIYPKHIEIVEHAKKYADKIIICEPYAIKPEDINAYDWPARIAMFLMKYMPERLYKMLDILLADNDGINSYETRAAWHYNKNGLKNLYHYMGINKILLLQDEIIGIWEK